MNILSLNDRPYQNSAVDSTLSSIRDFLKRQGTLAGYKAFFEMATGSGKTLVTYSILNYILRLRERYNRLFPCTPLPPLKIGILSHRIDTLDQLYQDYFVGRNGARAIVSEFSQPSLTGEIFHSKVKDSGYTPEESDIKFVFSTYQTAEILQGKNLFDADLIVLDDVHVVTPDSTYLTVIQRVQEQGRAAILGNTATPDNFTKEFLGEPIFKYSLAEYLASGYAPSIVYQFLGHEGVNKTELDTYLQEISSISVLTDLKVRKKRYTHLRDSFHELLLRHTHGEDRGQSILEKITNKDTGALGSAIVFCTSRDAADTLATEMSTLIGKPNIVFSYHSSNDSNKGLARLRDPQDPCKILVVVDKMNEGIDAPEVENIIFWRSTNSAKIFLQQFGRGLRGTGTVKYFDFVGGFTNFVAIHAIYQEYLERIESSNQKDGRQNSVLESRFQIGGKYTESSHRIDLGILGLKIATLGGQIQAEEISVLPLVNLEQLKELTRKGRVVQHHVSSRKCWIEFARKWNREEAPIREFSMPISIEEIYKIINLDRSPNAAYSDLVMQILLEEITPESVVSPFRDTYPIFDTRGAVLSLMDRMILPVETLYSREAWQAWFENTPKKELDRDTYDSYSYTEKYDFISRLSQNEIIVIPPGRYNHDREEYYIGGISIQKNFPYFLYDWSHNRRGYIDMNVGLNQEVVQDFIAGRSTKEHMKPLVNRAQLEDLLRTNTDIFSTYNDMPNASRAIRRMNQQSLWDQGIRIPDTLTTAVKQLGGVTKGANRKYFRALIRGDNPEPPVKKVLKARPATGREIISLVREGIITKDLLQSYLELPRIQFKELVESWNIQYSKKYGFTVMASFANHFISNEYLGYGSPVKRIILACINNSSIPLEFFMIRRSDKELVEALKKFDAIKE